MQTHHGEASFQLSTPELELYLTARGGHLAPVIFHLPGREVSPYALAPWQPGDFPELPPLLSVLRGDFLCLPFGGQVAGPPHGDPANAQWHLTAQGDRELRCTIDTTDSSAHIEKILTTREGHHALYCEHRISGLEGEFSYGNHPILDLSGLPEAAGRISTSAFHWASVFPGNFSDPAAGECQALAGGALFSDLSDVPLAAGGTTDLSRYPARAGNDDLVMMVNQQATPQQPFAWSAAVLDGYLWFALKNPADFPATALWMSNGGRSSPPWNSRHLGRIGIEEICSHFSNGVDVSRQNLLAEYGIPTTRRFQADETVSLKTVQAVSLTPESFGKVCSIVPEGDEAVAITGESGAQLIVPLAWKFIL
jgi:hypothetical protein